MKLLAGLAAVIMLGSLGAGLLLSSGPEIRSVPWSDGSGGTMDGWSSDIRLTSSPLPSVRPAVAVDRNGDLHIAWADFRAGEPDIYYKKVDAQGNVMIPDTRISASLSQSMYPAVAIGGWDYVHIAWLDNRGGVWNVYYARLDWSGAVLVTDLQITDIKPGRIDARSDARFQPPAVERLEHAGRYLDIEGRRPSIDVDGAGNAHIAWSDFRDGESDVRYTVVGAGGSILTDQARVSKTASDAFNAVVRVWGGGTVMLWAEQAGSGGRICYSRLDAAGAALVEPVAVWTGSPEGLQLDAAVDANGTARVAWSSTNGLDYSINYARVGPDGGLAGPVVQVASSRLVSGHPSIRVEGGGAVQLAWASEPERLQRADLSGVFYARLAAEGEPIAAPAPVTQAPYRSDGPALAVSGEGLPMLVWSDSRDGESQSELYMKTKVAVAVDAGTEGTTVVTDPGSNYVPVAAAAGGLGAVLAVALTEAGRWKLTVLAVPLYSRLRREGLLNHAIRERIFGYVNEHPGANFSTIMKELDLKNGVLAYHLTTLEREEMIRSLRDGTFRRYYPRSSRSVPFEVQKAILEKLAQSPGLAESELAKSMGLSRQVLEFHLNSLIDSGHVRLERRGKRNLAFATQVAA
jgi:DNA-binding transcriptional ArsR family regulator